MFNLLFLSELCFYIEKEKEFEYVEKIFNLFIICFDICSASGSGNKSK